MTMLARGKRWPTDLHYWASSLLALALVPLLRGRGLPVSFDWASLLSAYWLVLAAQSIFVATLLYLIGGARAETLAPFLQRIRREKVRIALALLFFLILLFAFSWLKALILTVDAVAILEFRERLKHTAFQKAALSVLIPAIYLFAGFLLVFAYNDIILSVRFYGATDVAFNALDKWLLGGTSVSDLCHWAVRRFPVSFFHFLEFIYFGMFPQIGAALILNGACSGKKRALQFAGTILAAYYLALMLFFLWPSQGPYYLCPTHFSTFPASLKAYAVQKASIANSRALWNHSRIRQISTDYYIAFPCMHIAQPLVVMWFLRPWRRMLVALAFYDLLLLAAIVLLEWHYIVDIFGGVLVAGLAIVAIDGRELLQAIGIAKMAPDMSSSS
ncbi:MAG: phosphatase PAP2 family protein [Terriglobales bacterium]|jgi:PAP2 superfamily protein